MADYIELMSQTYKNWETVVEVGNDEGEKFLVSFIGGSGKTYMVVDEISTPHLTIKIRPEKMEIVGCIAVPQDVGKLTAEELLSWVYDYIGNLEFSGCLEEDL
jgi:hypothetical protein